MDRVGVGVARKSNDAVAANSCCDQLLLSLVCRKDVLYVLNSKGKEKLHQMESNSFVFFRFIVYSK